MKGVYIVGNKLYKIYNYVALNEGFGNKKIYHQSLLGIKDEFKKFILPESLIFDVHGNYVGYVTKLVGDESKIKEGITTGTFDNFITNLRDFENESLLMSQFRFLTVDVGFHNSIYSTIDGNLYMIDPGRYHHQSLFTVSDYIRRNKVMMDDYFFHMLEREINYFKLVPKKNIPILLQSLKEEKKDYSYSEYFENIAEREDNIHEFIKEKGKYIY